MWESLTTVASKVMIDSAPKPIFFGVREVSSTSDSKRFRANMHTCGLPGGYGG